DVGRQARGRVERLGEQRVERGARGGRDAERGRGLVFGGGERELRLHHLEARRVAGVEACLRGVTRAHRQVALFAEEHETRLRQQLAEVGAAHVVAHLRNGG